MTTEDKLKQALEEKNKMDTYCPDDQVKLIHHLESELLEAYEVIFSFLNNSLEAGIPLDKLRKNIYLPQHPKMYRSWLATQITRLKWAKDDFDKEHGFKEQVSLQGMRALKEINNVENISQSNSDNH